jgi:hypothetical protein
MHQPLPTPLNSGTVQRCRSSAQPKGAGAVGRIRHRTPRETRVEMSVTVWYGPC